MQAGATATPLLQAVAGQRFDVVLNLVRTSPDETAAVAVFSPWADISRSGASMRSKDGADPLFSYDAMGWHAGRYMPNGDRSAPLASPAGPSVLTTDLPVSVAVTDVPRGRPVKA